jgi:hypothetical protein
MGLGDSLCMAEELLKPPESRWIIVDLPAHGCPNAIKRTWGSADSTLDLSQGGRFGRRAWENVVKSGHVVGLGSSLVLNPSGESELIGYVDNSGRLRIEGCRCVLQLTARGVSVFLGSNAPLLLGQIK